MSNLHPHGWQEPRFPSRSLSKTSHCLRWLVCLYCPQYILLPCVTQVTPIHKCDMNKATFFHGSASQFWPADPEMDCVSSSFLELFYWIRWPSPSLPTSPGGPWSPMTPSPWVCSAELGAEGEVVQPGRGGGRRVEVSPTMLVALGVKRGEEKGRAVIHFTSCQCL